MATIESAEDLGYSVALAFEGEDFKVYRIEGHGISLHVRDDDAEALASIADKAAHDERVQQQRETHAETQLRHHADKKNPWSLGPEALAAYRAQVSDGE